MVASVGSFDPTLLPPATLTARSDEGGILLEWTCASAGQSGFAVEKSAGLNQFQRIAEVPADTFSFLDAGATTGVYRAQSLGPAGDSPYTDTVRVCPPELPRSEAMPADLAVTSRSSSRADLSWTQPTGQFGGFVIQRAIGTEPFATIGWATASQETFEDWLAPPNAEISYRLLHCFSPGPDLCSLPMRFREPCRWARVLRRNPRSKRAG